MDLLLSAAVVISIAIYALYLIYVQIRRRYVRTGRFWISMTILLALLASLAYLIPEAAVLGDKLTRGTTVLLVIALLNACFGGLLISDVRRARGSQTMRVWLLWSVAWAVAFVATILLNDRSAIGQSEWLVQAFSTPDLRSWLPLAILAVSNLALLGIAFHAFYVAPLPEIANRALFWVIVIAVLIISLVLLVSGTPLLAMLGIITLAVGVSGALYTQVSYRVFDIRNGLSLATRTTLIITLSALIILGALFAARTVQPRSDAETNLLFAILALAVAILYVPARWLIETVINPLFKGVIISPTVATRKYSQQVSKAVELDELIKVSTETLNDVLGVRRSGLILVNNSEASDNQVELLIMPGGGFSEVKDKRFYIAKDSPIYKRLASDHAPLAQFDMEFSPQYKTTPETEHQYFENLHMSAYAPVIVENTLIGIVACGPKRNDAPFYPRDLEVMSTLANQTGVALRNARLVADLRHLNNTMVKLNKGLEEANQQMEKLDSVKTEFVTIASHELRTPLAQIRGYTDILDALNEQGMLNQDQTSGMVNNLRKASERMEELISAMLDVSQLDVDAMDLRFTQTTVESIVRLAIEPLTDAIKQRKLTLSARGLRGLPNIEADMQRLVQAFRNIVVNAIKFTPDGGRIEITASLQAAANNDGRDNILVAITDTGVGIDRQNLELVFEKFFRAYDPSLHSTGAYKFMGAGPGLGLTIARGVIEGHGGKIWAESPGHSMESFPGSTFYVLLPVTPPEDARRVLPFEGQQAGAKA